MIDPPSPTPSQPAPEVSDQTLREVIADFLAMGHVDNIVAMVRQEPRYLAWTGQLIEDGRYAVRLGVAVLFEHLIMVCPESLPLAVPGLMQQLRSPVAWVRGEAASLLGTIATDEALAAVAQLLHDPSPQVVEIVRDILDAGANG
ncbi:MAG: HEAT repeat domain-containing protein [Proteobacteria bacterium]|nr:HEAT repeat domain-containing protein [Pseudomonadota bacterium]